MPKTTINNITFYYEINGQGDETLVFVSGFGGDHLTWTKAVPLLKNKYQVVVFDNRGAGQTDAPQGPYSIEQMAEDTVALCKQLGIKKAHFIGNSMGGYIVQMLAYKHPQIVQSAIIVNSAMTTTSCFYFYLEAQHELLKAKAPFAAIVKANCCWCFSYQFLAQAENLKSLIEFTVAEPFPFTLAGYEGQMAALTNFDSGNWAAQIKVPTLITGADEDIILPESLAKALAKQIPQAKYYSFKNCGHLPHIEYAEQFAALVMEFINATK